MANARAIVEGICLKRFRELDKSGINAKYYEDLFKGMSNAEFDLFMEKMISGENPLSAIAPNYSNVKIGTQHNVKMAASMGVQLYQRIWVTDPVTGTEYLTTNSHLVYETNVCRQIQLHDKKISVPDNNTEVDARTGQPSGASRAARCSGPELMMIKARGLNNAIIEMMKFRGGDLTSMRYLDDQIIKTGHGSMAGTPGQSERMPKSVQTMSALLNAMMFTNNFAG